MAIHPHPHAMTLYQIKCESRWDPGRNLPDESGIGKRRGPLILPDEERGGGIHSIATAVILGGASNPMMSLGLGLIAV